MTPALGSESAKRHSMRGQLGTGLRRKSRGAAAILRTRYATTRRANMPSQSSERGPSDESEARCANKETIENQS